MRRTIVVHTRLAGHMARVDAARAGAHGVQILMMGQLAARLAGGFLAPIDPDCLRKQFARHFRKQISESSRTSKLCPAWCGPLSAHLTKSGGPTSTSLHRLIRD